jgi:hypothetical protein
VLHTHSSIIRAPSGAAHTQIHVHSLAPTWQLTCEAMPVKGSISGTFALLLSLSKFVRAFQRCTLLQNAL